jgi:hypothetical protein
VLHFEPHTNKTSTGASNKQRTIVPLTPTQVDDILYSIQLARRRGVHPVIPVGKLTYAVLRWDYDETGYSCPGGYSLVEVHLSKAAACSIGAATDGSILEMQCTCREFRSCRSGLGGKSRQGGGRFCTCCLMVVLANSLASALTDLRRGVSAWLLASQRPSHRPPLSPSTAAFVSQTARPKSNRECEIDDLLSQSFPEEWPEKVQLDWGCAADQLQYFVGQQGTTAALERPLQVPFPSKILPLPLNEPKCPKCINSDGQPRALERRRASSTTKVWIFVGKVVLRQPIETWACSAVGHKGPQFISTNSAAWTSTTGLLNVGGCWFFSILLLEAVTKDVRDLKASPTEACERQLGDSWEFMEAVSHRHKVRAVLPDWSTATRKLYDGWYVYEMVLKKVDTGRFSICLKCGILPAKLGADGCAKVAINLGKRGSRSQLDYTPQRGKALWTQEELLNHCKRYLLDGVLGGGSLPPDSPIPVDLVPPMFHNEGYAGERRNTEAVKRQAASSAHAGPSPTTGALTPLSQMISAGELDPIALRSESGYNEERLDQILDRLGCSTKLTSAATKVGYILKGYDTLMSGDSDCHMFVKAEHGTGGTCTISCPHGVVIVYKFCFSAESNRDHADNLSSLICEPAALWYDDSCGLVTHREGVDPQEFQHLYGENRGCPRPWVKNPASDDLVPIDIPELRDVHIRRISARDPEIRAHATRIQKAKGKMRCAPHPFCRSRKRLCLTDRWHQSSIKKTHKRLSCNQHLASMVKSLTHDRSTMSESLNARMKLRLRTICTANPYHAIPFYHRMVFWENKAIIEQQEREFRRCMLPGSVMAKDEVFKFAIEVCAGCRQQVADADAHMCQGMTEGVGEGGPSGEGEGEAGTGKVKVKRPLVYSEVDVHPAAPSPEKEQEFGEAGTETVSLGVGDSVLYTSSGQQPQLVRILKVHFDDPPEPYYTIDIGGVERETIGSHLRPACFPEDASLSRSSRSHKEEVKVELPKKRQLDAPSPVMVSIVLSGDLWSGSFPIAALPMKVVNMLTQLCSQGIVANWVLASDTGQYISASSFKGAVGAALAGPSSDGVADVLLYLEDEEGKEAIGMHLDLSLRLTSEGTWALHLEVLKRPTCSRPSSSTPFLMVTPPPLRPEAKHFLTSEEERQVNYALGPGSDDEILADFENIPVTRYDMHTLRPQMWLNDEV